MTAKEKARELVDKYKMVHEDERGSVWNEISIHTWSKQSALITVDEILNVIEDNCLEYDDNYWQEVKQEIESL